MRSGLRALLLVSAVLSASIAAHANSIVLDSMSGNTYTYGLDVNANSSETFAPGQTITLTGLSGVTGASGGSPYGSFFSASSTATSVTLTSLGVTFGNAQSSANDFSDLFTVTSSSGAAGTVNFGINGNPTASGTVEGPVALVAATPEPSGFVLLGTGLLAVAGAAKRRLLV
jgi:hypothetical protein